MKGKPGVRPLLLAGAVMLGGCGGSSSPTAAPPSVVGTWNAQTIDGVSLPAPDAYSQTLSDRLVVDADGNYADGQTYQLRTSSGWTSPIVNNDAGTWGGFGNAYHFRSNASNPLTPDSQATFDGTTLRVGWEIETSSGPIVQVFAYTR